MLDTTEHRIRTLYAGAEMRPRRWYTDELAPPRRAALMTSALWRYRSLAQRPKKRRSDFSERRRYFANRVDQNTWSADSIRQNASANNRQAYCILMP
jgi:hypothetical protein